MPQSSVKPTAFVSNQVIYWLFIATALVLLTLQEIGYSLLFAGSAPLFDRPASSKPYYKRLQWMLPLILTMAVFAFLFYSRKGV